MFAESTRRSLLKLGVYAAAGPILSRTAAGEFFLGSSAGLNWQLGANTAIEGYGLIQAIDTLRERGFTAIEIHPMGVPNRVLRSFQASSSTNWINLSGAIFRRRWAAFRR